MTQFSRNLLSAAVTMTIWITMAVVLFLYAAAPVYVQSPVGPGTAQNGSIQGTTTSVFSVYQAGGGILQITGTWVGTLVFESSADNGVTWASLNAYPTTGAPAVTGTTANITTSFTNVGYTGIRVRATAWTSGTATVVVTTSAVAPVVKTPGLVCTQLTPVVDAATLNQWNTVSCLVPANTLANIGDTLDITGSGLLAANANTKGYQQMYGPTTAVCGGGTGGAICNAGCTIFDNSTTGSGSAQQARILITKTGAATHTVTAFMPVAGSVQASLAGNACNYPDNVDNQITFGWRNTTAGAASVQNSSIVVFYWP